MTQIKQSLNKLGQNKNTQNNQPDEDNNKNSKVNLNQANALKISFYFWIYFLFVTLYISLIIYLVTLTNNKINLIRQSDHFYFANQVAYHWTEGFVNDIQISNNLSCPDNYTQAFNFQWAGSSFGCFCTVNSNITFLLQGYCTPALVQHQCQNVRNMNSTNAKFWRNNSIICIKRSSISFINQPLPSISTKICGNSDSLVIVPTNQRCPIVNISFTPFALQNNMMTLNSSILPPIYIVSNSTSSNSFSSYPINSFKVSQYEFCLIDDDDGIDPNHGNYLLLNRYRGCSYSGNYTIIDTITQEQFYTINPNLNNIKNIKGFPVPGNWEYHLGFSSMPSWSYKCRFNYGRAYGISEARAIFNFNFYTVHNQFQICVDICIAIILIELIVLFLRRIFKSQIFPAGLRNLYKNKQFLAKMLRILIEIIVKTVILAFASYFCYLSYSNWRWIMDVLNLNCMSSNPQLITFILVPYQNFYYQLYGKYIGMIIVCIIMGIIDIIYYYFTYKAQLQFYIARFNKTKLTTENVQKIDTDEVQKNIEEQNKNVFQIPVDTDDEFNQQLQKWERAQTPDKIFELKKKKITKQKKYNFKAKKQEKKIQNSKIEHDFNPYLFDAVPISSNQRLFDNQKIQQQEIKRNDINL